MLKASTFFHLTAEVLADGKSTSAITISVQDEGEPVLDDTLTLIVAEGAVGDVINNGDGTYSAVYTAPSVEVSGTKAVAVSIESTKLDQEISETIILKEVPTVAAKVELTAEKTAIPASLSATTNITVTVTDANGNKVKRENVDLTVDKGTIQTPAVNNGDGTYTATYAATDVSGDVTISALTSNGIFATTKIKLVEVAISATKSTLEILGSNKVSTDETASVVVTLVSEDGLPLSGRSVDLKVNPDDKVIINPSTKTDKDGKTTVVFASGKPGMKLI